MATLPANVPGDIPAIGFISHVDTSPDCSGKNVNPQIVENYRGGDIALGIGDEVLSPVMFPVLHQLLGQTLITTDGKTLLGADDKAGIAEIMTALAVLQQKNIPHGDIRVAFTPDEEVGKGRSILMLTPSMPAGLTPLMVVASANWSLKTSTPRRSISKLSVTMFTRARRKE